MRKTEAMTKLKSNQNGITLIALVITIIVLLILAGVAISMLAGDNGTLRQVEQAKKSNKDAVIKETLSLLATEVELAKYGEATEKALPTDAAGVIDYLVNDKKVVNVGELEVKGIQTIGYVDGSNTFLLEGIVEWPTEAQEGIVLSADGKTVTGYAGDGGTVIIPNTVTSIGDEAFMGAAITSIAIPGSVKSIGSDAFCLCPLTEVELQEGIESIGEGAFSACKIKNLKVPSSVKTIGEYAFGSNISLTSVELGNGIKCIEKMCFSLCESLTSVNIPNSVTSIGDYAFSGCALTSVNIPNSVTSLGEGAFSNCTVLTSVTIPNSVISMGKSAFAYTGLKSVVVPGSIKTIGEFAFEYNKSLSSVTFEEGVESIGTYAFSGCSNLENIAIPSTVTSIGSGAFEGSYEVYVTIKSNSPFKVANKITYANEWSITRRTDEGKITDPDRLIFEEQ